MFPSPRGVELHKPILSMTIRLPSLRCFRPLAGLSCINPGKGLRGEPAMRVRFRPLAGLSCINLDYMCEQGRWEEVKFPSPRGVELHKPEDISEYEDLLADRFRPFVGLSCINLSRRLLIKYDYPGFRPLAGLSCINLFIVVP